MKILHTIEFYSPSVGGAQEVVKRISEQLVKRGQEITVATTSDGNRKSREINGVRIEGFDVSGSAVHGFHGEIDHYKKFLLKSDFDLMMNYAAQQWTTDLVFPLLESIPYRKVIAPCGFSGLFDSAFGNYFSQMAENLRKYDHLIFHSDSYQDIGFARSHDLNNYTVVPNGALEEEFSQIDTTFRQRYGIPEDVPMLLTVGSHTGEKGHSLAIKAFNRARIGRAVLVIIGNLLPGTKGCLPSCWRRARWVNIKTLGQKRVLLFNPPRRDVIAAYHAADIFIFGSNIECSPLVLFEAMASKTPFITIACGNAEEIVNWGHGGIVTPTIQRPNGRVDADPKAMANAIEDLINDPDERKELAEAGYNAWKDRFTWEKIALEYERVYESILD